MKTKTWIIILSFIFLLMYSLNIILPLFSKESNEPFLLPEYEENVSLYDLTTFAERGDLIETSKSTGLVEAYLVDDYICENCQIDDIHFTVNDYVKQGDILFKVIESDYDGKVIDIINGNDSDIVIYILNLETLRITTHFNQSEAEKISLNQEASVYYNGNEFSAVVTYISPEFINGLLEVKLTISNKYDMMKNNGFVEISVNIREKEDVMLVNKDAIYYSNGQAYVDEIVIQNNEEILIPRKIVLGIEGDYYFEVISGVTIGTKIGYKIRSDMGNE